MPSIKLYWRKPVIKSVTAFRIVEHLDVVEDILPGVIPGCRGLALDALTLQQLEVAFSDSIVVTVSTSAHACFQPMRSQEIAPVLAGALRALIRMNHHRIVMAQERLQWSWRFRASSAVAAPTTLSYRKSLCRLATERSADSIPQS